MATTLDEVLQEKQALRSLQGFNVVGLDSYGAPDEQGLYLVGNVATPEEAKQLIQERAGDETQYFIYAADGAVVGDGEASKAE
jgi:hypothetical protein